MDPWSRIVDSGVWSLDFMLVRCWRSKAARLVAEVSDLRPPPDHDTLVVAYAALATHAALAAPPWRAEAEAAGRLHTSLRSAMLEEPPNQRYGARVTSLIVRYRTALAALLRTDIAGAESERLLQLAARRLGD